MRKTRYTFSELPRWVEKSEKIMDAVVSQATNDMLNSVDIVPGINRGGSRELGTIPRDIGALAGSLQSTLYGSTSITGVDSFVMVAGQMQAGDVVRFAWGGTAAPHARAVHYGSKGVPGTYWIDVMADGWSSFIENAVSKAKAEIG